MIPAAAGVYAAASNEVEGLTDDAKSAKSTGELKDIDGQVMEIYERAQAAAAEIRSAYSETDEVEDTVSAYLDRLTADVASTTLAAAATEERSPETYAALVAAHDVVEDRVAQVREVADSGDRLRDRWSALDEALRDYRLALVRHYIALGEPMNLQGIQIPG